MTGISTKTRMFINDQDLSISMKHKYNIIIEKDSEGWYISEVIELPGCHTQAKSIDQLMERTKEAIKAYLGTEGDVDFLATFVGVQQIEV